MRPSNHIPHGWQWAPAIALWLIPLALVICTIVGAADVLGALL